MFEAIICHGISATGTTVVDYAPFPDDSLEVTVMFKPNQNDLYGPHVATFGLADYNGCLVEFRQRQGLDNDGSILSISRTRVHYY